MNIRGRQRSGLGSWDVMEEIAEPFFSAPIFNHLDAFQAARSMFSGPKWYKEYVTHKDCRDFDLIASFPTAMLASTPRLHSGGFG